MPRFVISTEDLNRYGARVLTAGIDLLPFAGNPVMLYMHDRTRLPIGYWRDLRIEGSQLTGDAVFDQTDGFSQAIAAKVAAGTLRACSVSLACLELSENPALLLPGQTRPTVTKSVLLEVSIVDIPGNHQALRQS